MDNVKHIITISMRIVESVFALLLVFIVTLSAFASIPEWFRIDWASNQAFYDVIYRVLLLVIGLELARLLVTHNLQAVIELIGFVIARKTLKPDVTSTDVIYIVISFFFLIAARHILLHGLGLTVLRKRSQNA